jgi:hypothetical protein
LSQIEKKIAKNSVNVENVNFSSTFEQQLKITIKKIVVYAFLQFTQTIIKFYWFSCQVFCGGFFDEIELNVRLKIFFF